MHSSFENTIYKDHNHISRKILKNYANFSLKMSIFCNIYVVDKINN